MKPRSKTASCSVACPDNPQKFRFYTALVDTGAMISAISRAVAEDLQIQAHHTINITGIDGTNETNAYKVRLALYTMRQAEEENTGKIRETLDFDNRLLNRSMPVSEFTDLPGQEQDGFSVILGMDYLSACTLIVSSGKFILCY